MGKHLFDHEKLNVYQEALKFISWWSNLKKEKELKNPVNGQPDRSSESIVLNIAEGNGRYTAKDKCRFFDISRASALETSSALDILVAQEKLSENDIIEGKIILKNVVSMLIGLIKSKTNRVYDIEEQYNVE
ncbi:MAG: four helix bundle protein [Calditrichaeota bacterium]|nr:MAG: four helix bundle protein [Calditrichota bacterium]MBL1204842.1 four helix bundle protein [Calditrichota bacterium]NOG44671.1 four helix bundle protein [Calditrichota bacterium]